MAGKQLPSTKGSYGTSYYVEQNFMYETLMKGKESRKAGLQYRALVGCVLF